MDPRANTNRPNTNRPNTGRPGGYRRFNDRQPQEPSEFFEKVVQVNRVSKKTQGGDIRSLSVIVVVGDRKGRVGVGLGKARDAQSAVRKATAYAKRHLIKVLLKPAKAGTGVIAGGPVRVVVEAAGIKDVVSKTLGTSNKASNVYVTLEALRRLKIINVPAKSAESAEASKPAESVKKEKKVDAKMEKKS
jgi:small subunit ribosomal protein S5